MAVKRLNVGGGGGENGSTQGSDSTAGANNQAGNVNCGWVAVEGAGYTIPLSTINALQRAGYVEDRGRVFSARNVSFPFGTEDPHLNLVVSSCGFS